MPPESPDPEAGRLYDVFGASLYRYALMILASREGAEDVLQQVFVALISRVGNPLDDPERYLRRAVRNGCYSVLRERRAWLARRSHVDTVTLLEALPGPAPAMSEEVRIAMDTAIRELPADQREVLHMHAFEGRTFREIAEATEEPLNTIASRYRYALEKLRITLERKP